MWRCCEYRYDPPFKFTGKIKKLTFKLEPEIKTVAQSKAERGPIQAPEPDPIEQPGPAKQPVIEAAEMNGTPRPLLALMGAAEAATGSGAGDSTDLLVELLLGTAPSTVAGVTVSRVAGVALLALGVACWLARQDAEGRAARGLIAAMLLYNVAVVAILVLAWANRGMSGIALWPVVLAHAALAVWCVVTLSAASKEKRS